ncbi:orotidine-5'-phosphate decarboxylase [Microbacteriaceae bacterium SG_E_30_P1]|uniref:Orotidine-5'-phosphate decarboxylase n=1 Tax=Antiquaquibacter oligotrophicus TaxID=2880260 RepID=A0ABT6KLU3_9MICO|nr:orotidine-5'-phosphate decarboxylase [Antiquaquibacter oligotrophicus]MDH6180973.1 orotidine-5'-phosphate decarboxylase [Antiquaquibacter oligotrophicus]UDF13327.1 orotidine-5'-phosphate decarboxylase [Antiquaquibacter oligotrophicus]
MSDFGSRLNQVLDTVGPICLGIDPHPFLLSEWGLADSADGVREFGLRAVEGATGVVGIVKPQVAFFERHGSRGIAALEVVMSAARAAGLLVIADAKRGDIGSTVEAYGEAWLSSGAPLEADAMTVVAYQGVGSLQGVIDRATGAAKGLFILAATSNPEARETQTAAIQEGVRVGTPVARAVADDVCALNSADSPLGSIGVVVGGNLDLAGFGLSSESLSGTPILAPGYGEQGASLSAIKTTFGAASRGVVANVGRAALRRGPRELASTLEALAREAAMAR